MEAGTCQAGIPIPDRDGWTCFFIPELITMSAQPESTGTTSARILIVDDEELVLATLSRPPTQAERQRLLEHVKNAGTRQAGFVDIVWAIINMREFILNH